MAVDQDETSWLPEPPPARPAHRDAAIEAALRKFDGIEEPRKAAPPRASWRYSPRLGFAVSAVLFVAIGIPAAMIGIRDRGSHSVQQAPAPAALSTRVAPPPPAAPVEQQARVPEAAPVAPTEPAPAQPPPPKQEPAVHVAANNLPSASALAAPPVTAAPPPAEPMAQIAMEAPPPPPPPPPLPPPPPALPSTRAVANADKATAAQGSSEIVVTGARARQTAATPVPDAYRGFLERLQSAVRSGDKPGVIRLVGLPLRVNYSSGAQTYSDRAAVERDFARIFTPRVRRAVLGQKTGKLFVRDLGAMVGDGELWFSEGPSGEVRITAVNP